MGRVLDDGAPAHSAATRHTPLVIAHRGSSQAEPEHTLKAYQRAIEEGADGLECDVRLTADGHLVCVHDRRVNRTSNGRGIVSTLELAELEGLDWGSWKAAHEDDDEVPDRNRGQLLTLRALLTTVLETKRPIGLAIETKHPTRYAGLVERQLAKVLADFGLAGPPEPGKHWVRMMSFSQLAVQRMRQLCPDVPTVYLVEDSMPLRFRDGSLPKGVHTAGVDVRLLRRHPRIVERQHSRGHQVFAWTVDRPEDVDLCLELGVDAIISNRPRDVLDAVRSAR
ncbi:glycerophosphodiester phosphodiesterase [Knoellia sp. DB2414S]|uniref:Glycerophosphodiester phosphodiesterase n=1 Tax=Knoellia koreensis TaxID=2730921 RepID=A0A849HS62_9MICO|nr:glycerophosphodiester phosphodiesterase family protein [Knoellia sp. DB2414S]NNM47437.1 glycerophosphodiester phosphodiesterase [Knoellia sp. DB2414S]